MQTLIIRLNSKHVVESENSGRLGATSSSPALMKILPACHCPAELSQLNALQTHVGIFFRNKNTAA